MENATAYEQLFLDAEKYRIIQKTLATLDENIKCGNSIVASKKATQNAFDWKQEFPEVFANGGLDIIVGNPPYGASVDKAQKDYCSQNYVKGNRRVFQHRHQ